MLSSARRTRRRARQCGRPVEVRQYLERQGVVEQKEREALDKIYGLLSHTGAHPYMAEGDQARLLRQLSLTLGQFALLRLSSALKQPCPDRRLRCATNCDTRCDRLKARILFALKNQLVSVGFKELSPFSGTNSSGRTEFGGNDEARRVRALMRWSPPL